MQIYIFCHLFLTRFPPQFFYSPHHNFNIFPQNNRNEEEEEEEEEENNKIVEEGIITFRGGKIIKLRENIKIVVEGIKKLRRETC